jgi:hypothetical protein
VADDDIDEARRAALTAFLEKRLREGYVVETRSDTHAIISPTRWLSVKQMINPFRPASGRQVIAVDDRAVVTQRAAEPVRF